MFYNAANQAEAPVRGNSGLRNYVRGSGGLSRGFRGGIGRSDVPSIFQSGLNESGAAASAQPRNYVRGTCFGRGFSRGGYDFGASGSARCGSLNDSTRGNFGQGPSEQLHDDNNNDGQEASPRENGRGARGGTSAFRGFARGTGRGGSSSFTSENNFSRGGISAFRGFARGTGRGGSSSFTSENNFSRGGTSVLRGNGRGGSSSPPFEDSSAARGGIPAYRGFARGNGRGGSSSFTSENNFSRGGTSVLRGNGRGGSSSPPFEDNSTARGGISAFRGFARGTGIAGSSFLPSNTRGKSGNSSQPFLHGSQGQFFDRSQFGDVKKPQTAEHEPEALLPVTEEDKEIFGEDIQYKLAAQKLPRGRVGPGFIPVARHVIDVLEEDEKCAENYLHIADEDDEVEMEGFPSDKTPEIMKTWNHPKLQKTILENIANAKYAKPRKIQSYAIPLALNGYDIAVQSETGSGKTAAYLIPIVARCISDKTNQEFSSDFFYPYAVIIAPTRELAQQGYEQALKFVQDTDVTVARAYGEFSIDRNKEELSKGCDIIFVTPGRLADFVAKQFIMLNNVHFLVFDQGDRLLSGDFKRSIDTALFGSSSKMPFEHQTLFYSATFDTYDLAESNQYMRRKKKIVLKNKVTVPSRKCDQEFKIIGKTAVFGAIITYLRNEFAKVQKTHGKIPPTLIFCRHQIDCSKVAMALEMKEIPAKSISGLLAQDLREKALCEFRDGPISILCVTDLFSRGLDLKDIDVVINYEMPQDFETYIHRVGRVGRIRRGKCISFVQLDADAPILSKIKKAMEEAGHDIPQSLIDAVGLYKPPEKAAIGFNSMPAAVGDDGAIIAVASTIEEPKEEEKKDDVESNDTPPENVQINENQAVIDFSRESAIDDDDTEKPKDAAIPTSETVDDEKPAEVSTNVDKNDDALPPAAASIEITPSASEENGSAAAQPPQEIHFGDDGWD